jgi:hypothetical protein
MSKESFPQTIQKNLNTTYLNVQALAPTKILLVEKGKVVFEKFLPPMVFLLSLLLFLGLILIRFVG